MKTIFLATVLGLGLIASGAYAADAPAGATAQCKDGTYSTAASHKGACKGHQGVDKFLDTTATSPAAPTAADSQKSAGSKAGKVPPATTPAATPAASGTGTPIAKCKDGTMFNGTSHRGACKGHQGVDTWLDTPATTTPAPTSNGTTMAKPTPSPAMKPSSVDSSGATKTAPTPSSQITQKPGGGAGKVWVNSSSKVYHCEDDQWYGKTKEGSYMTEAAAKAAGNRASRGKDCS